MIQCHKCITQLLDVTDQDHTHTLGLQVPTHSQLVNNHTVQADVECPTTENAQKGEARGIASLLCITWQCGSMALENS